MNSFKTWPCVLTAIALAVACRPQQETTPSSVSEERRQQRGASIGPSGGALQVGRFVLTLPPNAVAQQTEISAVVVSDSECAAGVELSPHGQQFLRPVTLALGMRHAACRGPWGRTVLAGLDAGRWAALPTRERYGELSTDLAHFSSYGAVVMQPVPVTSVGGYVRHNGVQASLEQGVQARLTLSAQEGMVALHARAITPLGPTLRFSGVGERPWWVRINAAAAIGPLVSPGGELELQLPANQGDMTVVLQASPGTLIVGDLSHCGSVLGGTLNGRTCTLDHDLLDEVVLAVDAFTLDCAGHRVDGAAVGLGSVGLMTLPSTSVAVRNCRVGGFDTGILNLGSALEVHSSTIDGLVRAVLVLRGDRLLLEDNTSLRANGPRAVAVLAAILQGGASYTIRNNRLEGSWVGAVLTAENPLGTVDGNVIDMTAGGGDSVAMGVVHDGTSGLRVTDNDIASPGSGIVVVSTTPGPGVGPAVFKNNIQASRAIVSVHATSCPDCVPLPADVSVVPFEFSYQQTGNFYGRTSQPLFLAGIDSNAPVVQDSYPYCVAAGWRAGFEPGQCAAIPPQVLFPSDGLYVQAVDHARVFIGSASQQDLLVVNVDGEERYSGAAALGETSVDLTSPPLSAGSHTLVAALRGPQGSVESSPVTFTVDSDPPPQPLIQSPRAGARLASGPLLVAGTAEPGAQVVAGWLGQQASTQASAAGSFELSFPQASAGTALLRVWAMDLAGNTSATTAVAITVVERPEPPTIVAPAPGAAIIGTGVVVSGYASGDEYQLLLDGTRTVPGPVTSGEFGVGLPALAEGWHTVVVATCVRVDAGAFCSTEASVTFVVQETPTPPPSVLEPLPGSVHPVATALRVQGTAIPLAQVAVEIGLNLVSCQADIDGVWWVSLPLPPGDHAVRARQAAPDMGTSAWSDSVPFVVAAVAPTGVGDGSGHVSVRLLSTSPARITPADGEVVVSSFETTSKPVPNAGGHRVGVTLVREVYLSTLDGSPYRSIESILVQPEAASDVVLAHNTRFDGTNQLGVLPSADTFLTRQYGAEIGWVTFTPAASCLEVSVAFSPEVVTYLNQHAPTPRLGTLKYCRLKSTPMVDGGTTVVSTGVPTPAAGGRILNGPTARAALGNARRLLFDELDGASTMPAEIAVDLATRTVLTIRVSVPAYSITPGGDADLRNAVALAFLERYLPLLDPNVTVDELFPTTAKTACSASEVSFQRKVDGIPVLGSTLVVRFSPDNGALEGVGNSLAPIRGSLKLGAGGSPASLLPAEYNNTAALVAPVAVWIPVKGQEAATLAAVLAPGLETLAREGALVAGAELAVSAPSPIGPKPMVEVYVAGRPQPLAAVSTAKPQDGGAFVPRHHLHPVTGIPDLVTYRPVGGVAVARFSGDVNPGETVLRFLEEHPTLFRTALPRCQMEIKSVRDSPGMPGTVTVRMGQRHLGYKVFGAELAFEVQGDRVMAVSGSVLSSISTPRPPALNSAEAAGIVTEKASGEIEDVELGVLPGELLADENVANRLVYKVTQHGAVYYVDARTRHILYATGRVAGVREPADAEEFLIREANLGRPNARTNWQLVISSSDGVSVGPPGVYNETPWVDLALDMLLSAEDAQKVCLAPCSRATFPQLNEAAQALVTFHNQMKCSGWNRVDGVGGKSWKVNINVDKTPAVEQEAPGACPGIPVDSDPNFGCPDAFFRLPEAVRNVNVLGVNEADLCAGMAKDDVIAHELTHGLISHATGLLYRDQPGSIHEALANVVAMSLFPPGGRWSYRDGSSKGPDGVGGSPSTFADYYARNVVVTPGCGRGTGATECCPLDAAYCKNGSMYCNSHVLGNAFILMRFDAANLGFQGNLTDGKLRRLVLDTVMNRLTPLADFRLLAGSMREACDAARSLPARPQFVPPPANTNNVSTCGPGPTEDILTEFDCELVSSAFRSVGVAPSLTYGWAEPELGPSGVRTFGAGQQAEGGCPVENVVATLTDPPGQTGRVPAEDPAVLIARLRDAQGGDSERSVDTGSLGISLVTPPDPVGSTLQEHAVRWFSRFFKEPRYETTVILSAPPLGSNNCIGPGLSFTERGPIVTSSAALGLARTTVLTGFEDSPTDTDCVFDELVIELLDASGQVVASGQDVEAADQVVYFGFVEGPKRRARAHVLRQPVAFGASVVTDVEVLYESGATLTFRLVYRYRRPADGAVACIFDQYLRPSL